MGTRALLYRLAWLSSLFGAGCATVVAPTGGPEDKLSPRVAGISPAPNSVNQPQRLEATLQFDEWIASSIPRGAVAISPPLDKKIRLEVDGDVLRISSDAPLDSATTYTLTITNGLKDLRGNAISEPFTLVFSTGSKLDSLGARGRVLLPDSLRRTKTYPAVGLYPLGQERLGRHYLSRFRDSLMAAEADTLPRLHKEPPLFITHTDSTGAFQFQGLRPGLQRCRMCNVLPVRQGIVRQTQHLFDNGRLGESKRLMKDHGHHFRRQIHHLHQKAHFLALFGQAFA